MALARVEVPEDFSYIYESMHVGNQAVVLTVYGTSAEVLGDEAGILNTCAVMHEVVHRLLQWDGTAIMIYSWPAKQNRR